MRAPIPIVPYSYTISTAAISRGGVADPFWWKVNFARDLKKFEERGIGLVAESQVTGVP